MEDRVLLAGLTGKGKTSLARWIVEQFQPVRLIVFDSKNELDFGVPKLYTPAELAAGMHQPIVHYIPAPGDKQALEEACLIVWETPGPYVWWVDEGTECSSPNYVPAGLRAAAVMGRAQKKLLLVLTQRLAEIHPVFRSQAEHVYIFVPAPIELDLKAISGAINREVALLAQELTELHAEHGDYSHLWYVRSTDELRRCAPVDIGGQLPSPPNAGGQGPAGEGSPAQLQTATAEQEPPAVSRP